MGASGPRIAIDAMGGDTGPAVMVAGAARAFERRGDLTFLLFGDQASIREELDEHDPVSWAVAIADDYDDAAPRVVLTVEELGRAGYGTIAHLSPEGARRLRVALRDALREIGEATD